MSALLKRTMFAALAATLTVAVAAPAEAQLRFRLRPSQRVVPRVVAPPVVISPHVVTYQTAPIVAQPVPYLGFESCFDGSGEEITAVHYGTAAWRIGLEPGDRVIAVNGVALRYNGHGLRLLQAATYQGHVTLTIQDGRTGLLVNRTIGLGTRAVAVTSSSYVARPSLRPSTILRRLPR
jgi:predicted metalloprotease with PDZ domain